MTASNTHSFAVILVEPQLGENIGMCARAMWNCGVTDLRLVNPRDGWPSDSARAAASGADVVIDQVRVFTSTEEAIADLNFVLATTARSRDMTKPVFTPAAAVGEMKRRTRDAHRSGVLFGKEAWGLNNDDVTLADAVLTVPLNPAFTSLNLAQAVLLLSYEWFNLDDETTAHELRIPSDTRPANKQELTMLFEHLERELDKANFFMVSEKRPTTVRKLRNMLSRADMTEQEVRMFRGIISTLCRGKPGD
ncbi:MAG: RNA methyltransferase [Rhodospirillales bacterium]|nr:RNA methyltransferase [Rhodospirillales bacterium]